MAEILRLAHYFTTSEHFMDPNHPQSHAASLLSERLLGVQLRLGVLRLYVAIWALLLVGAIYLLRDGASQWLVLPVTITMTLLALCFWWIEQKSVAAIKSSEFTQNELAEGGSQVSKVVRGKSKNSGTCCGLDGYTCI